MRAAGAEQGAGMNIVRDWISRHVFALAIVVALPAIFFTFATVVNAVTPDGHAVIGWPGSGPCGGLATEHERAACMVPTLSGLPLVFEWNWMPQGGDAARRQLAAVVADDVRARYGFAIPAALLIFLSVPIIGVALAGLATRDWRGWPYLGTGLAVLAGIAGLHFQDSHPVRLLAAEHLLWEAVLDGGYPFFGETAWNAVFAIVDVTTVAAMAASAALIALFAGLAVRAGPTTLTTEDLRRRAGWFRTALGLGSVILVLAVAVTHGLMHWSSVLMAPGSREPLQSLASSSALYWGVIHSLTLVMVTVPTVTSIRLDVTRLPKGPDGEATVEALEKAGLTFDVRRLALTLVTIAGPMLTGPALDLVATLGP